LIAHLMNAFLLDLQTRISRWLTFLSVRNLMRVLQILIILRFDQRLLILFNMLIFLRLKILTSLFFEALSILLFINLSRHL